MTTELSIIQIKKKKKKERFAYFIELAEKNNIQDYYFLLYISIYDDEIHNTTNNAIKQAFGNSLMNELLSGNPILPLYSDFLFRSKSSLLTEYFGIDVSINNDEGIETPTFKHETSLGQLLIEDEILLAIRNFSVMYSLTYSDYYGFGPDWYVSDVLNNSENLNKSIKKMKKGLICFFIFVLEYADWNFLNANPDCLTYDEFYELYKILLNQF